MIGVGANFSNHPSFGANQGMNMGSSMPMGKPNQQNASGMDSGMNMGNQMSMPPASGKSNQQFDYQFIKSMITHHQGAIDMAKSALTNSQHPEIRQAAQKIINDQTTEIDQMKNWRMQWYGE